MSMQAKGRHRGDRPRLRRLQRAGAAAVVLGAGGLAAVMWPTAAVADAPVQTAWWNAVAGGGQAAPDPLTPAGGLHVSVASDKVLAFGALLYTLPQNATATIELKVSNLTATPVINPTSPTTDPAANVVACPITGSWKSGDDQPMDSAPDYDCTRSIPGSLSTDQSTLTFLADSSLESTPGQLAIAIVPVTTTDIPGVGTPAPAGTTQPFSLDLAKPDASSLTITSTAALPPAPPAPHSGGGAAGAGAGNASTAGHGATGSSGASLPGALTGSSGSSTTSDSGTSPVVAPPAAQVPANAPAAAAAPATSDRAHNAALAMLLLIGIGAMAMSSGQMQRAPRLLGGASRHAALAGGAGAAAATAAAAPVVPLAGYGSRGLGRFAKPRTEAPRPLT